MRADWLVKDLGGSSRRQERSQRAGEASMCVEEAAGGG